MRKEDNKEDLYTREGRVYEATLAIDVMQYEDGAKFISDVATVIIRKSGSAKSSLMKKMNYSTKHTKA